MKPSKARRRLAFEFADRQGAFHRAGTVGRRRRLGRAQQGWARAQSVDDLAGATGWTARSGLGSIDGGRAGPGGGPRRSAANHALRSCSRDGQCHVGASARHGEAVATSKKRPLPVQGQAPGGHGLQGSSPQAQARRPKGPHHRATGGAHATIPVAGAMASALARDFHTPRVGVSEPAWPGCELPPRQAAPGAKGARPPVGAAS